MTGSSDETDIVHPVDPSSADTAADTGRGGDVGGELAETGLTAADQATIEALNQGTALLIVRHGPTAGARFLLDADVTTVGRHPGNDIFLDDVTVSRKHAQFLRTAEGFAVRDVGSLNGTYVGRERIDGEAQLHTGDEVQIGKFRFRFHDSAGGRA
jgi:pSer/pThr/pTyr-binding forkhead associated (FHA) protein